jgi:hypothetical protein
VSASLEQLEFMRIIRRNPNEAFGRGLAEIWKAETGRNVTATHANQMLRRLLARKLVEKTGEQGKSRKGPPVHFWRLTEAGLKALEGK